MIFESDLFFCENIGRKYYLLSHSLFAYNQVCCVKLSATIYRAMNVESMKLVELLLATDFANIWQNLLKLQLSASRRFEGRAEWTL